jgi:type II secretory pathway pseudopilin PulG
MKQLLVILIFLGSMSAPTLAQQPQKQKKAKALSQAKRDLRHVVLFKFKESSRPEDIKKVEDAFRELPKKIKEIKQFEWGKNNSPEGLNQDLTHCFLVTFASEKDRETYLPHPEHKAFVEILKPHLDKVVVIDYWAEK